MSDDLVKRLLHYSALPASQASSARELCAEAAVALAAKDAEIARLRAACSKSNDEVCQTLGGVLGYPWFKDDQKNFPGATEADGVCVGDAVADSLAIAAAREITVLKGRIAVAEEALHPFAWAAEDLDDNESGELWERPAAMSIDCANLRAAAAYFALRAAQGEK